MQKPYLFDFPRLGNSGIGYISVEEQQRCVPFEIKRVFWTYFTPESIVRGRHAHYQTQQVLVAVAGRIIVTTETAGQISTFVLESPEKGLYLPPQSWHTMQYSHSSVQLAFASHAYDEADYIRDYNAFKSHFAKSL